MTTAVGGSTVEIGSVIRAVVLDVAKAERLVDLSLRPELIDKSKEQSSSKNSQKKVKLVNFEHPLKNDMFCVLSFPLLVQTFVINRVVCLS